MQKTGAGQVRVYGTKEIQRLRIIYMLRQARYSISAIYKSLHQYDSGHSAVVIEALNSPDAFGDTDWTWVGDRWQETLASATEGAREILQLIAAARKLKTDPGSA